MTCYLLIFFMVGPDEASRLRPSLPTDLPRHNNTYRTYALRIVVARLPALGLSESRFIGDSSGVETVSYGDESPNYRALTVQLRKS